MLRRSVACVCRCSSRLASVSDPKIVKISSAGYKSQYSIDKIYPNSDHDCLSTTNYSHSSSVSTDGRELFSGYIPMNKLEIKYIRGSGPGGQNVNKVNTKVEVRFHVDGADWIPEWIRERVLEQEQGRINKEGYLIVTSDATRKQLLNQADCMEKIRTIIFRAGRVSRGLTGEEVAVRDKRIVQAKQGVLREKKEHSLKKQRRHSPQIGDV